MAIANSVNRAVTPALALTNFSFSAQIAQPVFEPVPLSVPVPRLGVPLTFLCGPGFVKRIAQMKTCEFTTIDFHSTFRKDTKRPQLVACRRARQVLFYRN